MEDRNKGELINNTNQKESNKSSIHFLNTKKKFPIRILLMLIIIFTLLGVSIAYVLDTKEKAIVTSHTVRDKKPTQSSNIQTKAINEKKDTSKDSFDLSYITLLSDNDIYIKVLDSSGKSMGKDDVAEPISNEGEKAGIAVKEFLIPKPSSGIYTITLTSQSETSYFLHLVLNDKEGGDKQEKFKGEIDSKNPQVFILNFDKDNVQNSTVLKQ